MEEDLQYLTVGLPEDIARLKGYGDFERAKRVIDMRLEKDIPKALRKRLELEKWILDRLPLTYIYTKEQASKRFQEAIRTETASDGDQELEQLRDEGAVEWIFVDGQVRYKDNFLENLLKTRKDLWPRLKDPSRVEGRIKGARLLDETIAKMKEKGGLAYRFHIRTSLKVKKEAERIGAPIRVHLPIPVEKGQVKGFKLLGTSIEPCHIAPPDYPQRTVCMETELRPGEEFWVEYTFEDHIRYVDLKGEIRGKIEGERKKKVEEEIKGKKEGEIEEEIKGEREGKIEEEIKGGRKGEIEEGTKEERYREIGKEMAAEDMDPYLGEQLPHIRFTSYLRELTGQVVGEEGDPLKKARRIYDYLTTHMMYSFVRQYGTIDDLTGFMATGLKGDCGIYALLFITMCRIAGVPARWQSGLYATPLEIGCHDWARFYVEPYGWMYADCSFGGSAWRDGNEERRDFYFGNLDPFRVPLCDEFQHGFMPPRSFLREDPYDNQSGEAEYMDRGLIEGLEYETEKKLIQIEEIEIEEGYRKDKCDADTGAEEDPL